MRRRDRIAARLGVTLGRLLWWIGGRRAARLVYWFAAGLRGEG